MGKSSPPKPPSAKETAAAQTSSNIGTAIASTELGNVNQVTPTGNLTYEQTGTFEYYDPNSKKTYEIPNYTATTEMTPEMQKLFDTQLASQQGLGDLANSQIGMMQNHLSSPFQLDDVNLQNPNLNGTAPTYGNLSTSGPSTAGITGNIGNVGGVQRGFDDVGGVQRSFGDAGELTRSYGGAEDDYIADRQRVEEALMERMNPYIEQDRERLRQQLINQGFREGSEGYDRAMFNQERQIADQRFGAILNAGQEQSRLMNQAAQRAGFENAAQQQAYNQLMGRAGFSNQAQQQAYGQALGRGQFANEAQQQAFGQAAARAQFGNQAQAQRYAQGLSNNQFRNQAIGQQFGMDMQRQDYANNIAQQDFSNQMTNQNWQDARALQNRNQPINEISALMSGSQVSPPSFQTAAPAQIANTDVAGITNQAFQNQYNNWYAQQQQQQSMLASILGFGGGIAGGFR